MSAVAPFLRRLLLPLLLLACSGEGGTDAKAGCA